MKNAIFITIIVATCIIHTFSFAQTGTLAVTRKIANETIDPYLPDPNPPREIPGYHYVWGDEFNYEGNVDQTLWQAEKGFIRGNELQYYQMKNATVSEGRLLISAKKERVKNEFYDPNSSDYRKNTEYSQYTSASILGKQKRYFLFGRIEVRAKVDTAGGNFPAIWTCGYNKNWPQNGEIDIMEYYWANIENKYQPVLTANFCVGGDNRQDEWAQKWKSTFTPLSYYTAKDADWVNKYHVWRMDWDEEAISLYLDDELRNTLKIKDFKNYDGSIAFYNPQFMMLNLAVKVQRAGDYLSPTKFEVDYFRVYQKMIDTEKPSMVTGLKASNVSATTCTLSWDPSTDNVGVYRYDIYKNGLADGYFVGSATDTSFIVKGLSPSSKADFRVLALDSVGNYSDVHEPLSVSTPPTDFVEDGEIYTIINCNSGKVLTPLHSSRVSGTNIVQMTGSDDPAQKWVFADMGNGYWTIKNMDNGLAMDIEGASTADGAKNIQWTYTGANNQQWKLSRSGDFYTIVNRNSGKYLDISDASLEDGWPDIQWKANGGKNQLWELCRQKGLTCVDNSIVIPTNVFYDPRAQRISVTLNSGMNRSGWIVLADVDGRYIEKKPIKNHSVEFSTVKLLRGIYVVNIISDQEESYKILL